MNNILADREFFLDGGWYSPLEKIKSYMSVIHAEYIEMCSSAGDWTGLFFQKIGRTTYIIPFFQENAYPKRGYHLYTGEIWGQWRGKVTEEDIDFAKQQFIEQYY